MVGGVVGAGGLAFPAVVLEVDFAGRIHALLGVAASPFFQHSSTFALGLGVRDDLLGLLALDDGHRLLGNANPELEQALVNGAQLPDAQGLVVDEDQVVALVIEVAGEPIETLSEIAVRYLVGREEAGGSASGEWVSGPGWVRKSPPS